MGFERKYYARTTQFKEINTFCNHLVHPPLWKKQYGETMTSWILLSPAVSRQKCGCFKLLYRVPTRPGKPGKPGKMRVHLENLEISWNFEKFNKYHGKTT